jgi:hypothetical protein
MLGIRNKIINLRHIKTMEISNQDSMGMVMRKVTTVYSGRPSRSTTVRRTSSLLSLSAGSFFAPATRQQRTWIVRGHGLAPFRAFQATMKKKRSCRLSPVRREKGIHAPGAIAKAAGL